MQDPAPGRPAEQLPDPWLFDSEALLRELDRCRELTLQIPITDPNATHFGIAIAVNAQWNLRENLYCSTYTASVNERSDDSTTLNLQKHSLEMANTMNVELQNRDAARQHP